MKTFTLFLLSFCLMAGTLSAQKGFKLDRDEMGEVIEDIDFGFPNPKKGFPGPILKKMESNRAMIQKRYKMSDKEYNAIANKVLDQLRDKDAKQIKYMHSKQLRKADGDLRFIMTAAADAFEEDNEEYTSYAQSGAKDILDTGASGAAVGAALGGGIGLVAGPKGAAVGAAIGGALGAAFGLGVGAGTELAEEIDPTLEDN